MSEFAKPIKRRDFLRIAWMLLVSGVATTCSSKPITQGPTTAVATAIKKASTPFPRNLQGQFFFDDLLEDVPVHQLLHQHLVEVSNGRQWNVGLWEGQLQFVVAVPKRANRSYFTIFDYFKLIVKRNNQNRG